MLSRKSFPLWGVAFFGSLLSQILRYAYSMCIFTIQGVLKWTMSWNGLKIEMYDFNHYSCSPKKSLWGWAFWDPLVPNTKIYLFKVNFDHTGSPKKWTDWSHIYQFLAHFMAFSDTLYGENTLWISVCMYLGQEAPPHKRKHFWDSSYNYWNHIFQFLSHFMALSLF